MASIRVHRHHNQNLVRGAIGLPLIAAAIWWLAPSYLRTGGLHPHLALAPESKSSGERTNARSVQAAGLAPETNEKSTVPQSGSNGSERTETKPSSPPSALPTAPQAPPSPADVEQLIASGRAALEKDDLVAARGFFSRAFSAARNPAEAQALRVELSQIGKETIFSPRIVDGDPLVSRYVIQTGDSLARIAVGNKLSSDFLARINNIADKNRIREGQSLKIVKGPFRAVVTKRNYTLDVFLDDAMVGSFAVGLGAEDSTPTGEWRAGIKLVNPTYYPPRGGGIVAADDPANPLGERWIGLVGVSGSAMGQERYGIHGTNEPDSIGKNMSMGCIRMRNDDVEQVYDYLVENHSTILVRQD